MSANRYNAGSNYYYLDQSQPRRWWHTLLHLLLVLVTVLFAGALVMAYLSTGISPERSWIFAFFGLGAPFLFFGNFVLLLVWILRWRWWALVSAITLLLGLGHLGTLVRFDFRKEYPAENTTAAARRTAKKEPARLSILTYNTHGFVYEQSRHDGYRRMVDSVAAYVQRMQPDVICFQEYETMNRGDVRLIDSLYRDWPYRAYHFVSGGAEEVGYGVAIFSRLPILKASGTLFEGSRNTMLQADLLAGRDTLRLFNNHLQSTQVDEWSRDRVERLDVRGDKESKHFVRSLAGRLRDNYRRRAVQVDTISRMIEASPYPAIVTGDFNDTPVSYTYHKMRGKLDDTFVNAGSGFAYTYNRLFSMLRIDYVFHAPEFETLEYRSDALPWSDHNPVFVRIGLSPADGAAKEKRK
ncbi:endonuclease/exonuclease/phosphatase family protein [uncultured Rikenella sp.]|uniref:endonuclease/exonuclease/phosphatase family protein n=1 Tax=uncultured Rikenella sp. TaxID=368003 RepID=UPI00260B2B1B|nr:endonuclease/exonuclease/phosphatase family protein [uncultured Rikenella sp.]